MCATCGCSTAVHHDHHHDHGHDHDHLHPVIEPRLISLERDVLAHNDQIAARLRSAFARRGVACFNLVSSPGSGKTSLLERTLRALPPSVPVRVIEGDQETSRDADRIRAAGGQALQINTGTGCHLEAGTVERAVEVLAPPSGSLLFIENVGNLVCPALFDLGEQAKIVIASVTEGDDKPLKYPHMFRKSALVLLNKLDLLPHVPFEVARFEDHLRQVNPTAPILRLSALTGEGFDAWIGWLGGARRTAEAAA